MIKEAKWDEEAKVSVSVSFCVHCHAVQLWRHRADRLDLRTIMDSFGCWRPSDVSDRVIGMVVRRAEVVWMSSLDEGGFAVHCA